MTNEQTVTQEKNLFLKVEELSSKEINKLPRIKAKLIKSKAKSGRIMASIVVNVNEDYMKQISLRDGSNFLSVDKFNLILVDLNLELLNKDKRPITEWLRLLPVRFVKGHYKNRDEEYYSIEVIFSKDIYIRHFFDYDQTKLLEKLQEKNLMKIDWVQRPDAIEFEEFEKVTF